MARGRAQAVNKLLRLAEGTSPLTAQVTGPDPGVGTRVNMLELLHARPRIADVSRLPGPVGEVGAGGQGVRVLGAQDPLADGQQRGVLVAGPGRIPRLAR